MENRKKYTAALFDLDGVIVDTANYHYLAWKTIADELGIDFSEKDNERLKGVSRMESLAILLEIGRLQCDEATKIALAEKKNKTYVTYIEQMDAGELLPGVRDYIVKLRRRDVKIALCSASKNAPLILQRMQVEDLFDAVIDGNKVEKAKPDPEVFLQGARTLGVEQQDCVVFEDAKAGVQAAKAAGMYVVGIGQEEHLREADIVVQRVDHAKLEKLF
ncbi:UNVERIFIED_CONTAM: beta-phosphoglucomutase [Brevibacillus sp. OAP136]